MGIEVRPPDVHRQPPRVHGRGRGDPLRPAGRQERRPGRDRIDHRGARRGRRVPLARPTSARASTCASPTARSSSRSSRSARSTRSGTRRRSLLGLDDAIGCGPGDPARPDQRPDLAVRPRAPTRRDASRSRCRRRPRCRSASACAGRRNCSACTSRSIRWARSPSRSGTTSTPTRATCKDESLDGQRVVDRRRS